MVASITNFILIYIAAISIALLIYIAASFAGYTNLYSSYARHIYAF